MTVRDRWPGLDHQQHDDVQYDGLQQHDEVQHDVGSNGYYLLFFVTLPLAYITD